MPFLTLKGAKVVEIDHISIIGSINNLKTINSLKSHSQHIIIPNPNYRLKAITPLQNTLSLKYDKKCISCKKITKDFLPYEPYFLRTNCMRWGEAQLYVLKDFNFLLFVSCHKFTLKYFTIFVMNMPYGKTESSLNE